MYVERDSGEARDVVKRIVMAGCCTGLVLGSRSTNRCVFLCGVAAACDERYLVRAVGAAGNDANWLSLLLCTAWLLMYG